MNQVREICVIVRMQAATFNFAFTKILTCIIHINTILITVCFNYRPWQLSHRGLTLECALICNSHLSVRTALWQ